MEVSRIHPARSMRIISILVPLLLLLLLLPPGAAGLTARSFKQYPMANWATAIAVCRRNHVDLATINDMTENFLQFRGWIGLYRENSTSEWKWSGGDRKVNFTRWRNGYPKNNENCAFKRSNRVVWESDSCSDVHTFTCYDEGLLVVTQKKTWERALWHCRSLEPVNPKWPASAFQNHRYDLATLLSEDDNALALKMAQKVTNDSLWVGMRFLGRRWMWVGGEEEVQQVNLESCPVQKRCGTLGSDGTIRSEECTDRKGFLCYKRDL